MSLELISQEKITKIENLKELSESELTTVRLVVQGFSNREIAQRRFVTSNTIKSQLNAANTKLLPMENRKTRPQLILQYQAVIEELDQLNGQFEDEVDWTHDSISVEVIVEKLIQQFHEGKIKLTEEKISTITTIGGGSTPFPIPDTNPTPNSIGQNSWILTSLIGLGIAGLVIAVFFFGRNTGVLPSSSTATPTVQVIAKATLSPTEAVPVVVEVTIETSATPPPTSTPTHTPSPTQTLPPSSTNTPTPDINATKIPIIFDNFDATSLNATQWEEPVGIGTLQVRGGSLVFDLPQNGSSDWQASILDSKLSGRSQITRVRYTATLLTPSNIESGVVGVQTDCNGIDTYLVVYLGGAERRLFVEFQRAPGAEAENFFLEPIIDGQEVEIELDWQEDTVALKRDGVQQEVVIPCSGSKFLNVNAGILPGQALVSEVGEIQIWDQ